MKSFQFLGIDEIFDQNDFSNEDDPEVVADPLTGISLLVMFKKL